MTASKRFFAATLVLMMALPAFGDFNRIVRAIDSHSGVNRVWIPFLGVARVLVRSIQPKGIHDFQLATFEGADDLDPRALQALVESKLEKGFMPLVQVWSKKSDEWSFIYARPRGDRIELMVLSHDDEDTVLVRVDVDAEIIARELNHPRNVHRVARQH